MVAAFMAEHPAFTKLRLGFLHLDNRVAVAPMSRVSAEPDGRPTPRMSSITPSSPTVVSDSS